MEKGDSFLYDMVNDTFEQMFSPEWMLMQENAIQEYIIRIIADFRSYNEKILFTRNLKKAIDDRIEGVNSLMKKIDKERYDKFYNISEWLCTLNVENITKTESESPTVKCQRVIDKDRLKDYFVPTFYNQQNVNQTDYFTENLIPDLEKQFDAKQFAGIAWLIYDSPKIRKKVIPNSFSAWLKAFYSLIGTKHTDYKKSIAMDISKNLATTFYYLQ